MGDEFLNDIVNGLQGILPRVHALLEDGLRLIEIMFELVGGIVFGTGSFLDGFLDEFVLDAFCEVGGLVVVLFSVLLHFGVVLLDPDAVLVGVDFLDHARRSAQRRVQHLFARFEPRKLLRVVLRIREFPALNARIRRRRRNQVQFLLGNLALLKVNNITFCFGFAAELREFWLCSSFPP